MRLGIFTAAAAALLATSAADAAILTYRLSGTFVDGTTLGGQFSFDDRGIEYSSQFSNVAVTLGRATPATARSVNGSTSYGGAQENETLRLDFYTAGNTQIALGFLADYTAYPALRAIRSPDLLTSGDFASFYRDFGGTAVALRTGTVTLVPAAVAVPEPATWGLMLLGFGAAGTVLRSRRRSTGVAFA